MLTEEEILSFELEFGQELRNFTHNLWNSSNENSTPLHESMGGKMDHLMHSDTMILVGGLLFMILLGLVFRSLCLRLSTENTRKKKFREGLKQIAAHMDMVTQSMSNDLVLPNSPKTVMRTYSGRGGLSETEPDFSKKKRGSLQEMAFSNNLRVQIEQAVKESNEKLAVLHKRNSLLEIVFGGSQKEGGNTETKSDYCNGELDDIHSKSNECQPFKIVCDQPYSVTNECNTNEKKREMFIKQDSLREIAINNKIKEKMTEALKEDKLKNKNSKAERDSFKDFPFSNSFAQHTENNVNNSKSTSVRIFVRGPN